MIKLQNVNKYYGNKQVLYNVSFAITQGNIVGLLGKNGAGKSTLMNIITGYFPPTSGIIEIDGKSIEEFPEKAKRKIGYLSEKPPVYDTMTVREFLIYVAKLKKISKDTISVITEQIIQQTGLHSVTNRLIRNLSKGYQQRVGIAQAMIGNPEILILDEPTVGLDPSQVVEFRKLLREYGKEHIVIISSHILSEISEICQRILILNEGHLVKDCSIEELNNKTNHVFIRIDMDREFFQTWFPQKFPTCTYRFKGEREFGSSDWEIINKNQKEDVRKQLFKEIAENGKHILQMIPANAEIEDFFLNSTSVLPIKEDED